MGLLGHSLLDWARPITKHTPTTFAHSSLKNKVTEFKPTSKVAPLNMYPQGRSEYQGDSEFTLQRVVL